MAARCIALASLALVCACARSAVAKPKDAGEEQRFDATVEGASADPVAVELDAGTPVGRDAAVGRRGVDAQTDVPPLDASTESAVDAGSSADAAPMPAPMPIEPVIASTTAGGEGGGPFDDRGLLPASIAVKSLTLRTGDRVDRVELTLRDGTVFSHGGSGGSASTLELQLGDALVSARLCTGTKDGSIRVFYARFTTALGYSVAGGAETSDCTDFMAPQGRQIGGFWGRSGDEVDALGLLYVPR